MSYAATYGSSNYAGVNSIDAFPRLATVNLLDNSIGSGSKSGYEFVVGL